MVIYKVSPMHAKQKSFSHYRQAGFTIIEIMVVVVIIGILAAIIVPKLMSTPDKAKIVKVKEDIRVIGNALDLYKLDNGFYPTTDQGLQALVSKPTSAPTPESWHQYLPEMPLDPWNTPYHYVIPGQHGEYDLFTYGADNKPDGTQGIYRTIGNWNVNEIR